MKQIIISAFAGMAISGAVLADDMSADRVLLMTCMNMEKSIPQANRIPKPTDNECLLIRHAKGVPDTAVPAIGYSKQAAPPPPKKISTTDERCESQAEFFARVVASRQQGIGADTIYSMAINGDRNHNGKEPSKAKSDWYRKTILAVYENPRYIFSDPGADGMRYADSCKSEPGVMLIQE